MNNEQILNQKPIFDSIVENVLNVIDKINFSISLKCLDHLFLTSVSKKQRNVWETILTYYAEQLPHNILTNLTAEQWDVVSGKNLMLSIEDENVLPPSDSFIWRYADKLNWEILCCAFYHYLTEDLMREFSDKIDWHMMSQRNLTNEFVHEHAHLIDWNVVSQSRELDEDFIELFQDRVNWRMISKFQELSEEFIDKFSHKIDFLALLKSDFAPSDEFIAELLTRAYHD